MNAEERQRASAFMDPDEFKRLLEQFGKEAMARAQVTGYNMALSDMIKILLRARVPAATKEWLLNQCRGLERKRVH